MSLLGPRSTATDSLLPGKTSLTDEEKRVALCYVRIRRPNSAKGWAAFVKQLERRKLARPAGDLHDLVDSGPFRSYVRQARARAKRLVKQALQADAMHAVHDYLWARGKAKEAEDHKEVRLGAQDLFDRIGVVSRKEAETTSRVMIVLRGRNFDAGDLEKALPEITAEEIIENPEIVE